MRKQHSLLRPVRPPRDNEEAGGPDGGCARITQYALTGTKSGRITGSDKPNLSSLPKAEPVKKRRYLISEDRILQISNDISEDMCRANRKELVEVVKYFRDLFDDAWQRNNQLTRDVGMALCQAGLGLMNLAKPPK